MPVQRCGLLFSESSNSGTVSTCAERRVLVAQTRRRHRTGYRVASGQHRVEQPGTTSWRARAASARSRTSTSPHSRPFRRCGQGFRCHGHTSPAKEARKMDPFIHYGMRRPARPLRDSGLRSPMPNAERIGVAIGSGIGGLPSIEDDLPDLHGRRAAQDLAVLRAEHHHQHDFREPVDPSRHARARTSRSSPPAPPARTASAWRRASSPTAMPT